MSLCSLARWSSWNSLCQVSQNVFFKLTSFDGDGSLDFESLLFLKFISRTDFDFISLDGLISGSFCLNILYKETIWKLFVNSSECYVWASLALHLHLNTWCCWALASPGKFQLISCSPPSAHSSRPASWAPPLCCPLSSLRKDSPALWPSAWLCWRPASWWQEARRGWGKWGIVKEVAQALGTTLKAPRPPCPLPQFECQSSQVS